MITKILYTVPEASAVLSISQSMTRKLVTAGQLHPTRIGDRVLLSATELQRFVKASS
jgi:excisionase family DNA binding protein